MDNEDSNWEWFKLPRSGAGWTTWWGKLNHMCKEQQNIVKVHFNKSLVILTL